MSTVTSRLSTLPGTTIPVGADVVDGKTCSVVGQVRTVRATGVDTVQTLLVTTKTGKAVTVVQALAKKVASRVGRVVVGGVVLGVVGVQVVDSSSVVIVVVVPVTGSVVKVVTHSTGRTTPAAHRTTKESKVSGVQTGA